MSITIKDLVGKIFDKNENLGVQFLFQSFKGFKRNKQDTVIEFYTSHDNTPDIDFSSGEHTGKTAIIIWVDKQELHDAMNELEQCQ